MALKSTINNIDFIALNCDYLTFFHVVKVFKFAIRVLNYPCRCVYTFSGANKKV
jgi:hypothetical protein